MVNFNEMWINNRLLLLRCSLTLIFATGFHRKKLQRNNEGPKIRENLHRSVDFLRSNSAVLPIEP